MWRSGGAAEAPDKGAQQLLLPGGDQSHARKPLRGRRERLLQSHSRGPPLAWQWLSRLTRSPRFFCAGTACGLPQGRLVGHCAKWKLTGGALPDALRFSGLSGSGGNLAPQRDSSRLKSPPRQEPQWTPSAGSPRPATPVTLTRSKRPWPRQTQAAARARTGQGGRGQERHEGGL